MIVELELERRGHGQSSSSMLRSPFDGSHKKDGRPGHEEGSDTFRYANGDFYVGEWYAGKREGHGTYQDSDGNVYEGEWKADEMEGRGTIRSRSADGAVIYEGEWKAGQPCGLLMPGRTPKAHRLPTMDEKNKSRAEKIQAALFKLYPFVIFETVEPSKDEGSETQSYVDQGSELQPQQLWLEEVSNKEVSVGEWHGEWHGEWSHQRSTPLMLELLATQVVNEEAQDHEHHHERQHLSTRSDQHLST